LSLFNPTERLPFSEFIILMATMTSLIALSVDAMLPALPAIGLDLGVTNPNDTQLIVSLIFLGMAFAQLLYGPLSDTFGRKPLVYLGFILFFIGCFLCIIAETFTLLLIGRVLQGIGLGGPRIMSIAIIRDQFKGREMAKVMSFVMMIFILVPIIAPALGQGILMIAHWKVIFILLSVIGIATFGWFSIRQPETLIVEHRHALSLKRVLNSAFRVLKNPHVIAYTFVSGIIFGPFLAYISSVQQILAELYGLGKMFPLYFALLSASIGLAAFTNGKLVMRFGMVRISATSLFCQALLSSIFAWHAAQYAGVPPLWHLLIYFSLSLYFVGLLFGNLTSLAMEPLGNVAGVGASVVGFISSFVSVPLAIYIGSLYNNTVLPQVLGFAICASISLSLILLVQKINTTDVVS